MKIQELLEAKTTKEVIRDIEHRMAELEDMFKAKDFNKKDENEYKTLERQLDAAYDSIEFKKTAAKKSKPKAAKKGTVPGSPEWLKAAAAEMEKVSQGLRKKSAVKKPKQRLDSVEQIIAHFNVSPSSSAEKVITMALQIRQDCQPFLKAAGSEKMSLYRGIKGVRIGHEPAWGPGTRESIGPAGIKRARLEGRDPTDMDKYWHDRLNVYFTQKFGAPYRNAVFCTGDFHVAGEYGTPSMIFPVGDFEFIWSPKVSDLYTEIEDRELNFDPAEIQPDSYDNRKEYKEDVKKYKDDTKSLFKNEMKAYTNKNLQKAIKSKYEIMLRCKEYYFIDARDFYNNHVPELEKAIEYILK